MFDRLFSMMQEWDIVIYLAMLVVGGSGGSMTIGLEEGKCVNGRGERLRRNEVYKSDAGQPARCIGTASGSWLHRTWRATKGPANNQSQLMQPAA